MSRVNINFMHVAHYDVMVVLQFWNMVCMLKLSALKKK